MARDERDSSSSEYGRYNGIVSTLRTLIVSGHVRAISLMCDIIIIISTINRMFHSLDRKTKSMRETRLFGREPPPIIVAPGI